MNELDPGLLDRTINDVLNQLTTLGGTLSGYTGALYFGIALILFMVGMMKWMWTRSLEPVAEFFKTYILLMILVYLSTNWSTYAEGWSQWMTGVGGGNVGAGQLFFSPSVVLRDGLKVIAHVYETGISWYRFFFGTGEDTIVGLILLFSLGVFLYAVVKMCAVIAITLIFFKISSILTLFLLPFMLAQTTRFVAAPGVARMVQYGIQFFVLSLIVGFVMRFLGGVTFPERPDANEALSFMALTTIFAACFEYANTIAKEHISGMPLASGREGINMIQGQIAALTSSTMRLHRLLRSERLSLGRDAQGAASNVRALRDRAQAYRQARQGQNANTQSNRPPNFAQRLLNRGRAGSSRANQP